MNALLNEQKDAFIVLASITLLAIQLEPANTMLWASRFCACTGIIFTMVDFYAERRQKMVNGSNE